MTTDTTRFTPAEWSVVAGAPLLSAMSAMADGRAGRRATLAVVRVYRDARRAYDTPLLQELLAASPASAFKRPHDREALRREAPAALERAMEIVERVGTAEERDEYRRFVSELVDAVHAEA